MTNQTIFDNTYKYHILQKNPPGVDSSGMCVYRGEDGCRCGIGVSIPDNLNPKGLCGPIDSVVYEVGTFFDKCSLLLLTKIQSCHDGSAKTRSFHKQYEISLREIAQKFGLTIPTI